MSEPNRALTPPVKRWWRQPSFRSLCIQFIVLAGFILVALSLIHNVQTNLARQGIASGFAFLNHTAGFGIIMHLIDYTETDSYGRVFVVGLLNTLLVSVIAIVLASIMGVIIGVARLSSNWLVAKLSMVYIEIFRNIPLLLQIFFWYFAVLRMLPGPRASLSLWDSFVLNNRGLYLPKPLFDIAVGYFLLAIIVVLGAILLFSVCAKRYQLKTGKKWRVGWINLVILVVGVTAIWALFGASIDFEYAVFRTFNYQGGVVLIPELMALTLALSIYTAAFIAEIVRAGLQSVSKDQLEAGKSLGLPFGLILRLIVFPQAMRVIIPPLTNQYLNLAKNSSLAAAIAYPDLVSIFAGTVLNQTGQAIEVIALTMAVYLCMSLTISVVMNTYNRYHARWGN